MNKQDLENRIESITAELAQFRAHYAKLEGHLGEAQHWLSLINEGEKILEDKVCAESEVVGE